MTLAQVIDATVVLVVEDEPLLRLAAIDMVEHAGFVAVEARDADEAVAVLEGRDDVRVVFSDISMPGSMDGVTLATYVRDRWPPIHVILTSGHGAPLVEDMPAEALFFPKPYSVRSVAEAIRAVASA